MVIKTPRDLLVDTANWLKILQISKFPLPHQEVKYIYSLDFILMH